MRQIIAMLSLAAISAANAQAIPGQSDGIHREGDFVWFDLVTDDTRAAKTFYAHMFGWEFSRGDEYSIIRSAGEYIGSIAYDAELADEKQDALWIGSISVPDVDAAVAAARSAGGTILVAPEMLDGRGRSAVIEDPQGGVVALLRTTQGDPVYEQVISGDWLWVHLWTPDVDASAEFYEKALGYGRHGNLLQYFSASRATLVETDWQDIPAHWLPMVLVPDIGEAVGRVRQLGGIVHLEPSPGMGDGRMALVADPTGGAFLMQEGEE